MKNENEIGLNVKLKGQYKFVVEHSDGSVDESGWMDNLILNSGLDLLGQFNNTNYANQYLQVGTGTVPPDVLQTKLQTFLATVNFNVSFSGVNKGAPLYQTESTYGYQFPQGSVVGNITEVGICPDDGNVSNLFSRTLIVDGQGVPTALPVVALDRLTVYYKIITYPTLTDGTGSFVINNVTYNYTSRAANVSSIGVNQNFLTPYFFSRLQTAQAVGEATTGLSPVTGQIDNVRFTTSNITTETYIPGSYQIKATARFDINQGDSPFKGFISVFAAYTQFLVTPSIPKTNTNELDIKFAFSWGRG